MNGLLVCSFGSLGLSPLHHFIGLSFELDVDWSAGYFLLDHILNHILVDFCCLFGFLWAVLGTIYKIGYL